jgi:hypothetical protein
MKLSSADADYFYHLMWSLQFYVNQRLTLAPHLNSIQLYEGAPLQEKAPIRTAVYENLPLIDDFVRENPAQLTAEDIAIIRSWREHCLVGDFYIERFLKKGAIFLGDEPYEVYQVAGLHDSLEEMFDAVDLPVRVQTDLLPLPGQIIYDGLWSVYRVYFGSGVRSSLRESYMAAKQNGRIITKLDGKHQAPKAMKLPTKEWQRLTDDITATVKKLKGKRSAPIQSQAFSLLRASAELAETAVNAPDNIEALWDLHDKMQRALTRLENVLQRADWYK